MELFDRSVFFEMLRITGKLFLNDSLFPNSAARGFFAFFGFTCSHGILLFF